MTEDEAEAALLAVGAVLEWKPVLERVWRSFVSGDDNEVFYEIWKDTENSRYGALKITLHTSSDDYHYMTLTEAKAACEIHAATGQFPPSVEVVERS